METDVTKDAYQLYGIPSLKLNVKGNVGYPDRLFFVPGGKPLLIEFKRLGGNPEPYQAHLHKQLRELGYEVEVHDNYDEAMMSILKRAGIEK